jgi:tetratricopeptide (TPR) repeat protein
MLTEGQLQMRFTTLLLLSLTMICLLVLSGCQPPIRDNRETLFGPSPVQISLDPPTKNDIDPTTNTIFTRLSPAVAFVETPLGTGSGVLVEHGYLLSNAHVVWPFDKVRVVFPDGSEFREAPVLAWDLMADLALIGPLDTEIEPVALVDGGEQAIGTSVYLIGYPAEIDEFPQPSITKGILSRVRQWDAIGYTFFQVDATITGGQSGGVLVSQHGDIIGISTFYYGGFGLAGSVADALPRLNALLGNDTGVNYSTRRLPQGDGALTYTERLRNQWDTHRFVVQAPVETKVELTVEGIGQPKIQVQDLAGRYAGSAAVEGNKKNATLIFIIEQEMPYIVEVSQPSKNTNTFSLTSSQPLLALPDPDDWRPLEIGATLAAEIDTPDDTDHYELELEAGALIEITVDSLGIDPHITLRYDSPSFEEVVSDDDSGGGIFGSNARLVYKAPKNGTYLLTVRNYGYGETGGYFIHTTVATDDAKLTEPTVSRDFVNTAFGRFTWYESTDKKFAVYQPADWQQLVASQCGTGAKLCYVSPVATYAITEESLSSLPKKERTQAGYVALLRDVLEATPGFKVESFNEVTTLQRQTAHKAIFTSQAGRFRITRLVFVNEEAAVAFNITLGTVAEQSSVIEPLLDLVFDSFRYWNTEDRETSAVFHLDEAIRLVAVDERTDAIAALTESTQLDPNLTQAYTRRAWLYRIEGNDEAAFADLSRAIELELDKASHYHSRALLHWVTANFEDALADIDYAIKLQPKQPEYFNQRALIQVFLGNYEDALADMDAYQQLNDEELAPSALDTRGFIYLQMGAFERAKADFDRIFEQDLRFVYALLGGGIAYANLDKQEEARILLEEGFAKLEESGSDHSNPQLDMLVAMARQILAEMKSE